MQLDLEKLEEYKESFLKWFPDGTSFDHPEYLASERNYKSELVDAYKATASHYFPTLPRTDEGLIELANAVIALFTRPLEGNANSAQNLVGWRYWEFARILDDTGKVVFVRAVGALLDESSPLSERVVDFQKVIENLAKASDKNSGLAMQRSVTSFFLFLSDPSKYVFVKTREYSRSMEDLIGSDCLGKDNEYQQVLEFTNAVKTALESGGWRPKDLIDVQSFLWVHQAVIAEGKINKVDAEADRIVPIWTLRVDPEEIGDSKHQSFSFDLTDHPKDRNWYESRVEQQLAAPTHAILLGKGTSTDICGEASIDAVEINGDEFRLDLSKVEHRNISVAAKTNYQHLVPGLFTEEGAADHGAAKVCREFLDKSRPTYLLNWNPKSYAPKGAAPGRLGAKPGERARWRCRTKKVRVGDPVFMVRVGAEYSRGIIAKARVCSEAFIGPHWDPSDDSNVRYVMIEYESVRDDPQGAGINAETLNAEFPEQEWSPQGSGISVKEEYRQQLHSRWNKGANRSSLAELFEEFSSSGTYLTWIEKYRVTTNEINGAIGGDSLSEDLVEKIWYTRDNGIASPGQGGMNRADFEVIREDLAEITERILAAPNAETASQVLKRFESLKAEGKISRLPRLLIRRAFAAASPATLTTVVNEPDMAALHDALVDQYGLEPGPIDDWYENNYRVRHFLLDRQVDDSDLAIFNTFCWYLFETLTATPADAAADIDVEEAPMAMNLILYGPPGTGKTHTLRQDYFAEYSGADAEYLEEEWMDLTIGQLSWYQVIAAVLVEIDNEPTTVPNLVVHPFVHSKMRALNRTSDPNATIWSNLQHHTVEACPNVNIRTRHDPAWYWKDENSQWTLVPEWDEAGQPVVQALQRWHAGPEANDAPVERYAFITFHQSYSYEEFVEGIRPKLSSPDEDGTAVGYSLKPGIFRQICEKARRDQGNKYALLIDEINRGNISKIFGELITLLEPDKRSNPAEGEPGLSVVLPYSGDKFSVPANLDVIGTMNTADRSLAKIDTALRRRFTFRELMPEPKLAKSFELDGVTINGPRMLEVINKRIEALIDREHMIGHAYLMNDAVLKESFKEKVIPLLVEYFFEDWSKIREVLADDRTNDRSAQFVHQNKVDGNLFKSERGHAKFVYELNDKALDNPDAYRKIYDAVRDDE